MPRQPAKPNGKLESWQRMYTCGICSNKAGNQTFHCQERMFGWGNEFTYFQCAQCGCLQIAQVPPDLHRYYPPNYYSFQGESPPDKGLKAWLAAKRDYSAATGKGLLGKIVMQIKKPRGENAISLSRIPLRKEMRMLDVGCGGGELLSMLRRAGFRQLAGIDPYLSNDIEVVPGLFVRKLALEQVKEQFDVIMLHHVFEHIDRPLHILQNCRERLAPGGKILLRFPTAESEAWEHYRECWVQLDAPRHLFLHSRKSLTLLAEQAGLRIEQCWCDSTAFQFWASELYRKNIPLTEANPESHFTKARMKEFAREAKRLNKIARGDQLAVILAAS